MLKDEVKAYKERCRGMEERLGKSRDECDVAMHEVGTLNQKVHTLTSALHDARTAAAAAQ